MTTIYNAVDLIIAVFAFGVAVWLIYMAFTGPTFLDNAIRVGAAAGHLTVAKLCCADIKRRTERKQG